MSVSVSHPWHCSVFSVHWSLFTVHCSLVNEFDLLFTLLCHARRSISPRVPHHDLRRRCRVSSVSRMSNERGHLGFLRHYCLCLPEFCHPAISRHHSRMPARRTHARTHAQQARIPFISSSLLSSSDSPQTLPANRELAHSIYIYLGSRS